MNTIPIRSALMVMGMAGAMAVVPAGHAHAQQAAYVLTLGADTFAVENFTRTGNRIDGEMSGALVGHMKYTATIGPTSTVDAMTLSAWAPGVEPTGQPAQDATLTVQGDSVIVVIATPAGAQTQRIGSQPGAFLYLNPSFALIEQLIMSDRAARPGDGTPLFMVQGGATVMAVITPVGADSVLITMQGQQMRARVDGDGHLLGGVVPAQNLFFTRVDGPVRAPAPAEPPDYTAPAGAPYTAEEVRITTPAGHVLAGTLTRPAVSTPVPAVVTITGSGAQDRDQHIPMVRDYRPFREIADTLGRRGVAVLRLDDRGFGESTGDFATATSSDFADDIRAALDYLRTRDDIDGDRLGLIGHSEGGVVAPMVAATDTTLRGIVLIAGTARTGHDIITYQQRYAVENTASIPAADRDSTLADAARQLEEAAAQQPWLRFFLEYDPLPTARRVRTPVLILQGETDRQVTADQAAELADAFRAGGNADVTVHVLPGVNHLMLTDADGNPAGYPALTDTAVVDALLGLLADWTVDRLR